MTEVRLSRPEEREAQERLWQSVFGDDPRYIDAFYRCCGGPECMLLLLEAGELVSMLALLPHGLTLPGGERASGFYVYALATAPEARDRGYGLRLLREADGLLRARGADCATVVPAQPGLFAYFAAAGFTNGFFTRTAERTCPQAPDTSSGSRVEAVEAEAYNAIRHRLLADTPSVCYPDGLIRYQQEIGRLTGGGLFRVTAGGAEGCAAVEYADEARLVFKELLLPPEQLSRGVEAFGALYPGRRCQVRTPAAWAGLPDSRLHPFGMLKWYRPELAGQWGEATPGYLGLGFD